MADSVFITSFGVEALFGTTTYSAIGLMAFSDSKSPINVIFGDNGAGKTTLLHLLYATVSAEDKSGLRTYISRTPFASFRVAFSDHTVISITKQSGLTGDYNYLVTGPRFDFSFDIKATSDGAVREQDSANDLHRFLKLLDLDVLFVDHERYVRSTYSFLNDASYAPDSLVMYDYAHTLAGSDTQKRNKSLQFPLAGMIDAVNRNFRSQAFRQGTAGDQDASNVYLDIVKAITRKKKPGPSTQGPGLPFNELLTQLESETASYVSHGLLSAYPFSDIRHLYDSASIPRKARIREALDPFITSVRRRISAIEDVHSLMKSFEDEINKYLTDKIASVHALDGLSIRSSDEPLDIVMLSSGERQLLFLLCAAVVSRGARSLILIDEPELSLNYKWQRQIASSLTVLSSSQTTQFLMASHSIEIISRFSGSAYELVNEQAKTNT